MAVIEAWVASAAENELSGVTRDKAAIGATITEPWSKSSVEGQIDRRKTHERQMYGGTGYHVL